MNTIQYSVEQYATIDLSPMCYIGIEFSSKHKMERIKTEWITNYLLTEHEGLTLIITKPASGHIHELLCDRGHITMYMTVINK